MNQLIEQITALQNSEINPELMAAMDTVMQAANPDYARWKILQHVKPGDIVTFGIGVRSCRVIANNETGLVLDYEFDSPSRIETWSNGRVPPGIRILPADSQVGIIDQ